MKKFMLTTLVFFISLITLMAQKPQEILGVAKETKSKEYYETQSKLWKQETLKNSKDAYAWWNYYKAMRSFYILNYPDIWANDSKEIYQKLKPIIAKAKTHVGDSFEYQLLEAVNTQEMSKIKFLENW